jgi:hypothetical protein
VGSWPSWELAERVDCHWVLLTINRFKALLHVDDDGLRRGGDYHRGAALATCFVLAAAWLWRRWRPCLQFMP